LGKRKLCAETISGERIAFFGILALSVKKHGTGDIVKVYYIFFAHITLGDYVPVMQVR
jgi:hypothetical protein